MTHRLLLAIVLLGILAKPLEQAKGQARELSGYVLLFVSTVPREEIDEPHRVRAQYLFEQFIETELPNVQFDYRATLSPVERKQAKESGEDIVTIRLSGEGNTRKADVIEESSLHHATSYQDAAMAENVNVEDLLVNKRNLLKIAKKIREHHESCHMSGKECQ